MSDNTINRRLAIASIVLAGFEQRIYPLLRDHSKSPEDRLADLKTELHRVCNEASEALDIIKGYEK